MKEGFEVLVGMVTAQLISPRPVSFHIQINIRSIAGRTGNPHREFIFSNPPSSLALVSQCFC